MPHPRRVAIALWAIIPPNKNHSRVRPARWVITPLSLRHKKLRVCHAQEANGERHNVPRAWQRDATRVKVENIQTWNIYRLPAKNVPKADGVQTSAKPKTPTARIVVLENMAAVVTLAITIQLCALNAVVEDI